MANLSSRELSAVEELFQLGSGYVLDFSNSSFQKFVISSIKIDIYQSEGYLERKSKANKLRQIIENENDRVVGILLDDLLQHYLDFKLKKNDPLSPFEEKKLDECKDLIVRLKQNSINVLLPSSDDDDLNTLKIDIEAAIQRGTPELVLDRLHTFSTKYLRTICSEIGIDTKSTKGDFYPLHSLAGRLKNYYKDNNAIESEFTIAAIQTSINLFEKFNDIRNGASFAHDNVILNRIEAEYTIKSMINLLQFLEKLEKLRRSQLIKRSEDHVLIFDIDPDDLPF